MNHLLCIPISINTRRLVDASLNVLLYELTNKIIIKFIFQLRYASQHIYHYSIECINMISIAILIKYYAIYHANYYMNNT